MMINMNEIFFFFLLISGYLSSHLTSVSQNSDMCLSCDFMKRRNWKSRNLKKKTKLHVFFI